jgi:hypothetical protein
MQVASECTQAVLISSSNIVKKRSEQETEAYQLRVIFRAIANVMVFSTNPSQDAVFLLRRWTRTEGENIRPLIV